VPPVVHSYHESEFPALRDASYIVFPAYHQEFSGVWGVKSRRRSSDLHVKPLRVRTR
jgi:hypothetical protein